MDFLDIFYPEKAEKAFPFKTPICNIKHLPIDLGHQEGPKEGGGGEGDGHEIILTVILYLLLAPAHPEE